MGCPDEGYTHVGRTVRKKVRGSKATSWQQCGQFCTEVNQCQFFTFVENKCTLRQESKKRTTKDGAISGDRSCAIANAPDTTGT